MMTEGQEVQVRGVNTLSATLMCEGCGKPTPHVFVKAVHAGYVREDEPTSPYRGVPIAKLIYGCQMDDCKEQRVWGCQVAS